MGTYVDIDILIVIGVIFTHVYRNTPTHAHARTRTHTYSKDVEFLASAHVATCLAWAVFLRWQSQNAPGLSNLWSAQLWLQYIRCGYGGGGGV